MRDASSASLASLMLALARARALPRPKTRPRCARCSSAGARRARARAASRRCSRATRSPRAGRNGKALRCEVLARLNRREALLARVDRAAAGPRPRAAQRLLCRGRPRRASQERSAVGARATPRRLLWQRTADADEAKAARLTVIESYLAERRGEDAFRSMLRFQQDYQPLERAVTERFAEALLDLGLDSEALNWLARPTT